MAYGWPPDEHFLVPEAVLKHFQSGIGWRGKRLRKEWDAKFAEHRKQYPELAAQIDVMARRELPAGWDADIPVFPADAKGMATRVSSGKVLNQIAKHVPWLMGGSADLAPSNNTLLTFEPVGDFSAESPGRNLHFGVREHVMGAIANGMALCGMRPYAATFFVFSDYMRPSVRLAALMGLPVLYVYTHDSIGVGEDGPTHQPIEHLAAMRAIPGLFVIRPADANEVAEAYRVAFGMSNHPVALVLTRQNLPTLDRTKYASAAGLQKGGYVLADFPDVGKGLGIRDSGLETDEKMGGAPGKNHIPNPQSPIPPPSRVILIASGSEVAVCLDARDRLAAEGIAARVVSLASWALFDQQPQEYRDAVLPPDGHARVGVELGIEFGWQKYLGCCGRFVGMKGYGASAPVGVLLKHFGITAENVVAQAEAAIDDATRCRG